MLTHFNDTLSGSDVNNNRYYFYTFGDRATDILYGGDGNDTYILAESDIIREEANAGIDTVISYINYTLGDNLENLTLAEPLGAIATYLVQETISTIQSLVIHSKMFYEV